MSRAVKVLLVLASIPLLFLAGVAVVLAAPTVGTGLTFRTASVSIQEHHPGGTHLSFPIPAVVLDGGLRLAIASGALDDMEPLPPEVVEMLPALGEAPRALAEAPDHTLVHVVTSDEEVRVEKRGAHLVVRVCSAAEDVDVSVPIAFVPRALDLLSS